MPCRTDPLCDYCLGFPCNCGKTKDPSFDVEGALCDVLELIQNKANQSGDFDIFERIDPKTICWWDAHSKNEEEKIKKEALAKLTPRERKALGFE